jgi:transcriptional regulator with XRE-family HTH domain
MANRLRELRESARMRQKELAHKAKITPEHLCRLEKGRHTPEAKTMKRLADALGVDVGSVFLPESEPETVQDGGSE